MDNKYDDFFAIDSKKEINGKDAEPQRIDNVEEDCGALAGFYEDTFDPNDLDAIIDEILHDEELQEYLRNLEFTDEMIAAFEAESEPFDDIYADESFTSDTDFDAYYLPQEYHSHEVKLCKAVSLRYTVSISQASKRYKKTGGYYNNIRFYLYSTKLKKSIGKDWRTTYLPTKQDLASAADKPLPKEPSNHLIRRALTKLLTINAGISSKQTKKTHTGTKEIDLFKDQELFVFWITRYDDIATLDLSSRTDEDRQKAFAKVCMFLGKFNLNKLCCPAGRELDEVCERFASELKKALQVEKSTSNTRDKMQIVRYAISLYLKEKGLNPKPVIESLIKYSVPKKSITAKIADNMRPQSLPVAHYARLYNALKSEPSDISKGLQLMLFLGLTKEEVCGLNVGDVQRISGYLNAIHICISRIYQKSGNTYSLRNDEENVVYRFVPLPFPIYKLFPNPCPASKNNDLPLLADESGARLKPDEIERRLKDFLKEENNELVININGRDKKVNLAFLYTSYRASARYYWHFHCGLTEGEIHYLGGLTAPDTLSGHYIDFNNSNEQYRMLKQLEHGMALLTREAEETRSKLEIISKRTTEITAGKDTRAVMNLMINAPVKISLSSWRGLRIVKEGDK